MSQKKISFFIKDSLPEQKKVANRQAVLTEVTDVQLDSANAFPFDVETVGSRNCENLVGSVSIPVGVVGPVPISITFQKKETKLQDVVIPMATTEGALVASVNRGAKAVAAAGGAVVVVKRVGMSRAPVFQSTDAAAATAFAAWVKKNTHSFEVAAKATSNHLHFISVKTFLDETYSFVRVAFDTEEAMGMNMVSVALEYWWNELVPEKFKKTTTMVALSGNVCVDKKPSRLNRELGRGFWVTAQVELSEEIVRKTLGVSTETLLEVHRAKNIVGCKIAGTPAQNMHVANAVAAVFLATGQDSAHVVDVASAAALSFEGTPKGVIVTLDMPTIPVGTVGGGTSLAQQKEWLQVAVGKSYSSTTLAAVVAVAALSGEISGLAALGNHTLASAHSRLARGKQHLIKRGKK